MQQQRAYQMMTRCISRTHPRLQCCHVSPLRAYYMTCLYQASTITRTWRCELNARKQSDCFHTAALAAPRPTHSPAVAQESHAVGCVLFFGILCGMRVTGFLDWPAQSKQTSICSLLAEVCYSAAFCK